jgi:hypothetical protein
VVTIATIQNKDGRQEWGQGHNESHC